MVVLNVYMGWKTHSHIPSCRRKIPKKPQAQVNHKNTHTHRHTHRHTHSHPLKPTHTCTDRLTHTHTPTHTHTHTHTRTRTHTHTQISQHSCFMQDMIEKPCGSVSPRSMQPQQSHYQHRLPPACACTAKSSGLPGKPK